MIERASVDEAYLDITSLVEKRDTPESYRELAEILSNSHVIGETHSFTNDEGTYNTQTNFSEKSL